MTHTSAPHVLVLDTPGLGDRGYVVHDGTHALVVDPQRDIDRVEALVAEHGLTIDAVAETHVHNDYVSGGLELARRHGAAYLVPAGVDLCYDATAVRDGDTIAIGALTVRAVHTPGHTPHHTSYAVERGDHPGAVFTGGSMLYGSVGRPDLVAPELTAPLAHDQWQSVRRLADDLDGHTHVFPTHGFGSFCSATQTEGLASTIAAERHANPALTQPEQEFVDTLLAGLDVFPAYYAHMGPANAAGPDPVDLTLPAPADPAEIRRRVADGEWVVDLRSHEVYAAGHVPGSLSFDLDGPFVTYLAWMMPAGTPLTLLGQTTEQIQAAQRELVRVGVDRVAAQAVGGPLFWLDDDQAPATSARTDFAGLARAIATDPSTLALDTRQLLEWEAGHVAGALLIPFYELATRLEEIPLERTLHVYCGSGYRAAAAVSLLRHHGFDRLVHVDDDWENARGAGLPVVAEAAPAREPGWTWRASRGSVRAA